MAWKFPISTNTGISLGTTDNIYIAEGVLVGAQSTAIMGTGTSHQVEVYGTVITALEGISLGPATNASTSLSIHVGESGHVVTVYPDSTAASALFMAGGGGSIVNDGEIKSTGYGVFIKSAGVADANTIVNHGVIDANCGVAARGDSLAIVKLVNSGTITGSEKSYGQKASDESAAPTHTIDQITNRGSMIGDITLSGGDDLYNGRSGIVKGTVYGGDGADRIYGGSEKNILDGGAGVDKLMGGKGADKLVGGTDADTFIFTKTTDSTTALSGRDTIMDFSKSDNDTLDLHSVDANTKQNGNQAFHFIAGQTFHHNAGELRFEKTAGDAFVYGDVDGDGKADFAIKFDDLVTLTGGDFML